MVQAYHVSRHLDLNFIKPNDCNSMAWDGLAYGLKAACFTTTTLRGGGLPTISLYPRDFDNGAQAYRYTMTFDPDDYFKFQMAKENDRQVHYVLLRKNDIVEGFLAAFIRACAPKRENREWDAFFPSGRANVYRSGDSTYKFFVNILFVYQVPVTYLDTVNVHHTSREEVEAPEQNHWIRRMLQKAEGGGQLQEVRSAITSWYNDNIPEFGRSLQPVSRESSIMDLRESVEQVARRMEVINQIIVILQQLELRETNSGRVTNNDVVDMKVQAPEQNHWIRRMLQKAEGGGQLQEVRSAITSWYNDNIPEFGRSLQPVSRESSIMDLRESVEQVARRMEVINQIIVILQQLELRETNSGRVTNNDVADITSTLESVQLSGSGTL